MDKQRMTMLPPHNPAGSMQNTVRRLGWFSVGLGLAELLAPRAVSACLGLGDKPRAMTAFGLREVATGIGILASNDPTPWIWARVGGDFLDITAVATGTTSRNPRQTLALVAFAAVAGVTAVDVLCARWLSGFQARRAMPLPDYSNRSGFPRPPMEMRGGLRSLPET